jgi:hypothetical protein
MEQITNSIIDTISSVFSPSTNTPNNIPINIPNNLTNTNVASDDEEFVLPTREAKKKEPETPEFALNEYYKLKNKYEVENMKNKKKIMNNTTLSNKEKRQEYVKLKPKCINCKRPGGTLFSVKSFPLDNEKETKEAYKEFKAQCGILADPCNLNITIQIGKYNLLPNVIQNIEKEIKLSKDTIIDNKNKLLFGYITTETALEDFENEKVFVNTYTSLLEEYLNEYIKITDNPEKNRELKESLEKSYEFIEKIKESIRLYKETESIQLIKDVVDLYITSLQPLLRKIMALKYRQNVVYYDEHNNTFHLIQNKTTIKSMEYTSFADKVVAFDVGFTRIPIRKQEQVPLEKPNLESEEPEPKFVLKPTVVTEKPEIAKRIRRVALDEPIYGKGKDGILWNLPEYNIVWDKLPSKTRNALKSDNDWLKEFMFNCVNAQANGEKCQMVAPPNLKSPPNQIVLPNGELDFGVPIYNEVYNNLDANDKKNYLLLSSTVNGKKVYNDELFKNIMNKKVAAEIGLRLDQDRTLNFNIDNQLA